MARLVKLEIDVPNDILARVNIKTVFPLSDLRYKDNHLILIMGIPLLIRRYFYIEAASCL